MQCMKEAATGLPSESPLDVFVCDQDFCVRSPSLTIILLSINIR